METEYEQVTREENLRNASGFLRTIQVVGIFMAVLWLSGTFRASAWEPDDEEEAERISAASSSPCGQP